MGKGQYHREHRRLKDNGGCCMVAAIFAVPYLNQYADIILPPIRMFRDKFMTPYVVGRFFAKLYYRIGGFVLNRSNIRYRG